MSPKMPTPAETMARFWSKVDKSGECWIWTAYVSRDGYGRFRGAGRASTLQAHRVAYEYLVGPIPGGLTIDHLCRVKDCVNPGHMEVVTRAENARRGALDSRPNRPRKTHCIHGHEFTPENAYRRPDGHRNCRACLREQGRAYRARRSS